MPECQFRVSCCFWFQKYLHVKYRQNWGNLFLRTYNIGKLPESEDHLGGGPRGPHPMGVRPRVGPRAARVRWPHLAPGAHPSPIYCPRRVNPNTKKIIPRKVPSRHQRQSQIAGVLTSSRHPTGGEIITGGFYIIMHASGVMRE